MTVQFILSSLFVPLSLLSVFSCRLFSCLVSRLCFAWCHCCIYWAISPKDCCGCLGNYQHHVQQGEPNLSRELWRVLQWHIGRGTSGRRHDCIDVAGKVSILYFKHSTTEIFNHCRRSTCVWCPHWPVSMLIQCLGVLIFIFGITKGRFIWPHFSICYWKFRNHGANSSV